MLLWGAHSSYLSAIEGDIIRFLQVLVVGRAQISRMCV